MLGVTLPDPELKWNEARQAPRPRADRLGRVLARHRRRRPLQPRTPRRARRRPGKTAPGCARPRWRMRASKRRPSRLHERHGQEATSTDARSDGPDRMAAVGSVRAQQGRPRPQALRQPARRRRARWRSSWRATSTRGARKAAACGWCAPTRSSPATRATRTCTSIRWKTRCTGTRPSTSCPKAVDHM